MCTERHQGTSLPNTSKIGRGGGSTVELLLPEHCCCYGGKPGCLWRPFWLFSTYKKQGGSKNIFFVKKGHMGAQPWTPICPFFYTKNLFSAQLDFPPPRTAKKAPKPTWACFHCCSSALATVFQLPQPWTPIWPFFYEKNFFRPSLIFRRQEQPKRRPKPPGLASIATAVLWQQYFNCHNRGRIERN